MNIIWIESTPGHKHQPHLPFLFPILDNFSAQNRRNELTGNRRSLSSLLWKGFPRSRHCCCCEYPRTSPSTNNYIIAFFSTVVNSIFLLTWSLTLQLMVMTLVLAQMLMNELGDLWFQRSQCFCQKISEMKTRKKLWQILCRMQVSDAKKVCKVFL